MREYMRRKNETTFTVTCLLLSKNLREERALLSPFIS